ncbi:MAG: hypothetical protein GY936_06475 [Ignavibacteriae bacterium]|nr:hypothetical protein [Ignavibacteriota bacterium]
MKIIILLVFLILQFACADDPFVKSGNENYEPLSFTKGEFLCMECKMQIDSLKYSAEAVLKNGDTYFFDDPGCVALWLNSIDEKNSAVVWMYSLDTERWIDGRKAYYSLVDNTPMFYGFGAYEKKQTGLIVFDMMFAKMIRGENLSNPKIRKNLLEGLQ